jgi:ribosomal protein S18 acetylase RimI-like enzyme
MEIRLANTNDVATISFLSEDVQKIHATALPHLFKPPSSDTFPPSAVVELLADPNNYIYIGQLNGKDIGYIYAEVRNLPETPFRYAMSMIYVHHISLSPDYQHKGFGKLLIEAIKVLARAKGIPLITLDVWSFNKKAHAFFEKQGFENFNERMWLISK